MTLTVAQTLPRTHRCDATVGKAPSDFGFVPVTCRQTVGVATFVTTAGLRVGYCAREGHQASVRRRFAELPRGPGDGPVPSAVQNAWNEASIAAEDHAGHDETLDPECPACRHQMETFGRFGVSV